MANAPGGSLDVFLAYFDTGSPRARKNLLAIIIKRRRKWAHTIIMGDFNYTLAPEDRLNSKLEVGPCLPGVDAKFWNNCFGEFTEFDQPMYTCQNTRRATADLTEFTHR